MTKGLLEQIVERHLLPVVDEGTIDAFLSPADGEAEHTLLFFAGDPAQRPETSDVAVILPELLGCFGRRLRGAVVAAGRENALKERFHVLVLPTLVVTRGAVPVEVLPKVLDWAEYVERIHAALAPSAPVFQGGKRPAVQFTVSSQGGRPS